MTVQKPKTLKLPTDFGGTVVYIAYGPWSTQRGRAGKTRVLYVGVSDSFFKRMGQHASRSDWWGHAERLEVEVYPTRSQALARERELVRLKAPPFNEQLVSPQEQRRRADMMKAWTRCATLGCDNGVSRKHRRYCDDCAKDSAAKRKARIESGATVFRFGGAGSK